MPEILRFLDDRDRRVSVVSLTPSEEEIFLLYSTDFKRGPGIRRPGDRSPSMRRIGAPWDETTDPFEQRLGTWFIQEDCKKPEEEEITRRLKELGRELRQAIRQKNPADIDRLRRQEKVLQRLLDYARSGAAYDGEFRDCYPEYDIIGQQGCGDLTMNLWYVAYLCSTFTKGEKVLVYLQEEPVSDRTYTCLVKWRDGRVTVEEDVRLNPYDPPHLSIDGEWVDKEVEFAVSGKPVIRKGEKVDFTSVVHQFSDMRHLFQLPNLNPDRPLPDVPGDQGRRRYYYGRYWDDDVWFGEKQLLDDWNLQRTALRGAIVLDRLYAGMGASEEQVAGAMKLTDYQPPRDPRSLQEGEWQFVPWNKNLVEVYLRRNFYPWGMIGVDEDKKHVLAMACSGRQGQTGYTIEQACDTFIDATRRQGKQVWRALLMDEGNDVFQKVEVNGTLEKRIPLRRRQLRASFIFARRKQQKQPTARKPSRQRR
jgi:hypothetical protein